MVGALRLGPPGLADRLGNGLGRLAGRLYPNQRVRARVNIAALRPDLAPEPAVEEAMGQLARTFCEAAVFDRLWPAGLVEVVGAEHLAARPALLLGLHTGCWPLAAAVPLHLGHVVSGPHQPPASRFRAGVVDAAFQRIGGTLLPGAEGPGLLRRLRAGESVILYLDEHAGGRVAAPSLGRGPRVGGNIAYAVRLARLAGLAPVLVHAERLPGGRHRVVAHPPMALPRGGDRAVELAAGVAMLDALIEPIVRRLLLQWMMLPDFRPEG